MPAAVMPIALHGDAAFAGQGITAETLNLADLPGYRVGGTLHVVVNNQIGFTTSEPELHSSPLATDIAHRLAIPIFHVNGEDLPAVVRVARLATAYRYAFGGDVVIDLVGYRRHGHSEVDDPTITQPRMYQAIKTHPSLWQVFAAKMGIDAGDLPSKIRAEYGQAQDGARRITDRVTLVQLPAYWTRYKGGCHDASYEVDTGVPLDELQATAAVVTSWPAGFNVHAKVRRLLEQRAEMADGKRSLDYGMAEALAFGTLLRQGVPVRLTGQDTERGTFNQRHAVLVDTETEQKDMPLGRLAAGGAFCEIHNSPLSEAAALAFEYRLQPRLSRSAGALGSAVRRLRQRRAGRHRPVPQRGRRQVEPALGSRAAAAARLRRAGPRALQRQDRTVPAIRRRGQPAGVPAVHRRPVLPPAAAPGTA